MIAAVGCIISLIFVIREINRSLAVSKYKANTAQTFHDSISQSQEMGILKRSTDGSEMVYIPAGEFLMGTSRYRNEKPEHVVYLDAYWIDRYEVTNAQYRQCIEAGECSGDVEDYPEDDYPAVYVTWYEAEAYCIWAGGRLPTEAEWEKAARGIKEQDYPWGDESPNCELANSAGCEGNTMPVGSYPEGASPYGVMDMAGNVWEWVADWYKNDYYRRSPNSNPIGPVTGDCKVIRGGSWYSTGVGILRVSFRDGSWRDDGWYFRFSDCGGDSPAATDGRYGFRCILLP